MVLGPDGKPASDHLLLDPIRIEKGTVAPDALAITNPLQADIGDLRLLGYDLSKQGGGSTTEFGHGEFAILTLYWQATAKPGADYQIMAQLRDERGQVVWQQKAAPDQDLYPTGNWDKDEVVQDQHRMMIEAAPGHYSLLVGLVKGNQSIRPNVKGHTIADGLFELTRIKIH